MGVMSGQPRLHHRDAAARVGELGDDGTQDALVSQIIRTGETQVWFLAEHLVAAPVDRG